MRNLLRCIQRSYTTCHSKIYKSARDALHDVKDGDSISMGGFGIVGIPENGVFALIDLGVKDISIISNVAGISDYGIGLLLQKGQVKRMNASYVGENPVFERQYLNGEIELNLIPQGTLAERCRSGSNGIGAIFVKAGVGTLVETGGFPIKLGEGGKSIAKVSKPKEKRIFDGQEYLLEEAIKSDYAMIRGYKADGKGNVRFRKTAKNFNPDMAGMGRVTVLEVEEIVDELKPEEIHLPGCFVDRVYKGEHFPKKIERLRLNLGDQMSIGNISGKDE
jgi:3-oxoacid CoA-transferase